jgi:hypothetical protein
MSVTSSFDTRRSSAFAIGAFRTNYVNNKIQALPLKTPTPIHALQQRRGEIHSNTTEATLE